MSAQKRVRYPLGSRERSLRSRLLLLLPFPVVYVVLRLIFPNESTVLFLAQIPIWLALLLVATDSKHSARREWRVPWFTDLAANLAYGSAEEDGIHYWQWRRHFVSWKGIQRLEYWPERGGRVDLHLYNRWSPIIFRAEKDSVDYMARKLEEAWPGHSVFLLSFEAPHSKETSVDSKILVRLGMGREVAVMLAAILLAYVCCYFYGIIRIKYPNSWWLIIPLVYLALGLILGLVLKVSGLSRRFSEGRKQAIFSDAPKRLHE